MAQTYTMRGWPKGTDSARLAMACVLCLVLIGGACKQDPVAERVAVAGDSNTVLATMHGGDSVSETWDADDKIGLGWQAEHALPRVNRDVRGYFDENGDWHYDDTSPDVLQVHLGHNDVMGDGGFTLLDIGQLEQLVTAPHSDACTVVSKPYRSGGAERRANIQAYRDWVDVLPSRYPERIIVTVDLEDWVDPVDDVQSDGVHVKTTSAPQFVEAMHAGVAECRDALS